MVTYNVKTNYKTLRPRAFYALYIEQNDGSTGRSVFKLSTKKMVITPKCKPVPMPNNVVDTVNKIGEQEGMLSGIYFCNIHKESTLGYLYGDIDLEDGSSCTSDESWNIPKKDEIDLKKIEFDDGVDDDEVDNLVNEDALHLNDGLANNNNIIKHIGVIN